MRSSSTIRDDRVPLASDVGFFQKSLGGLVAELEKLTGDSVPPSVEVEQFDEVGPRAGDLLAVGAFLGEPRQDAVQQLANRDFHAADRDSAFEQHELATFEWTGWA